VTSAKLAAGRRGSESVDGNRRGTNRKLEHHVLGWEIDVEKSRNSIVNESMKIFNTIDMLIHFDL
jgi:hypothetical protein